MAQGVGFAFSKGRLPDEVFDAVAFTPEEGAELAFAANAERDRQEALEKLRMGIPW